ncbi:hypothetical protein GmHk_20G057677 [Glycine max]|nr:hypothetical protein GmHk_20G057677 [Glycine max]
MTVGIFEKMSRMCATFPFREYCSLVRFEPCSLGSLGKMPFLLLSFFQSHFQHYKLFLHHLQPPLATTNRRFSPLKPHTERNPSTEAKSSNLPRAFGRERNPNLTFHFTSRNAWNRRVEKKKKSPSDMMRNPRCTGLPGSLALALGHVHTSYVVYVMGA